MDSFVFFSLFGCLSLLYLFIGYRTAQTIKTAEDYFLAGRSLGFFPLMIALVATQLGGGVILGSSQDSYLYGAYGLLYVISITIGFLALASGIAQRMRSFNVSTTAEIFEKVFHSPRLKKIASLLSIISLSGLLTAQIVASRNLMLSLQVFNQPLFIIFWLIIIGYTMMGGLRAVVNNDIFQLAFIMCVFVGIFAYDSIVDPTCLKMIVTNNCASLFSIPATFSLERMLALLLIPACYCLIEQDIAQTIFAARTQRIAFLGAFTAGIVLLVFACIPVYFGMKARLIQLPLAAGANPLVSLFDQQYHSIIVTVVAYGIFAAIISTADALLCAISSHIVQDFQLLANTRNPLRISQCITALIGITTMIASQLSTNVLDVIIGSYDIPVMALFVALFAAYCSKTVSTTGAYLSMIMGLLSFLTVKYTAVPCLLSPEITALLIAGIAYVAGYRYDQYNKHLKNVPLSSR